MFNLFNKKPNDESLEEQAQDLTRLVPELSKICLAGENCDEISNTVGQFGTCPTNPIPVNGPIGEIKYIGRLRNNTGLIFHRLGSLKVENSENLIDVFEVVSIVEQTWDILYFDMYHPRRSTKAPKGYKFYKYNIVTDRLPLGFGTQYCDPQFPFNISKFIERDSDLFGTGITNKRLATRCDEFLKDKEKFMRPEAHKAKAASILKNLEPSPYRLADIDILNFDFPINENLFKDTENRINQNLIKNKNNVEPFIGSLNCLIDFIKEYDEYLEDMRESILKFFLHFKDQTEQLQILPGAKELQDLKMVVRGLGRIGGNKIEGYIEIPEEGKPILAFKEEEGQVAVSQVEIIGQAAKAILFISDL